MDKEISVYKKELRELKELKKMRHIGIALLFIIYYLSFSPAGAQPTVTTNKKYARGATMAFGRMGAVANGSIIVKRGFCWATHPHPTIADSTTTKTMSAGSGTVYVIEGLQPATLYYMRAYAMSRDSLVGYGDIIKFATVPKGNVTYWYNNGGPEAANTRVNNAATEACDIFNQLTSIVKKYNIGYSAGTPTADCYYADEPWMNMGANASYQKTGTIMHEMQHGLGLVPYTTQWNKNILRESLNGDGNGTGHWLGERVTAFLDFWDNTTGQQLNGDYQHMWPYGINGAHEDNGTKALYYANAMIGQALGEDGLEHRSNTFAEPCYIFEQEDSVKYYLKCEDTERGLYDAFLVPTAAGALRWRTMPSSEALQNDSCAWHVTFTPGNQYYQLRNAATGQYMTYSGGFKTLTRTTLTANDNFHLMRGRTDVGSGSGAQRGYWLVRPTGTTTPSCLCANAGGLTASKTFDLANSATQQRWLILDAGQLALFEQAATEQLRQLTASILAPLKALADVPHTCSDAAADQAFADAIADIEQRAESAETPGELSPLADEARQAALDFLNTATPSDVEQPFDLTFMLQNPGMDAADGWSQSPALNYSCAEFYQTTFDFYQTVKNLPKGTFRLCAQGFQRPGTSATAYNDYAAGTNKVNAYLYAGAKSEKLAHIASEAQTQKLGGSESTVGSNRYMPNDMRSASIYFAKGLYENSVVVKSTAGQLKLGLRCTSMPSNYWCIFDNFRLHFFGTIAPEELTAITSPSATAAIDVIYTLDGRRLNTDRRLLSPGLYIINGKKEIVRGL